MRVRRVRSEDNVADLGTKLLSKAVIAKHCLALGCDVLGLRFNSQLAAAGSR